MAILKLKLMLHPLSSFPFSADKMKKKNKHYLIFHFWSQWRMSNRGLQSPNHQKEKNKNQTRQSFQSHLGIKSLQRRL